MRLQMLMVMGEMLGKWVLFGGVFASFWIQPSVSLVDWIQTGTRNFVVQVFALKTKTFCSLQGRANERPCLILDTLQVLQR